VFQVYGHLNLLAAYSGECVCRRKGKRMDYSHHGL